MTIFVGDVAVVDVGMTSLGRVYDSLGRKKGAFMVGIASGIMLAGSTGAMESA